MTLLFYRVGGAVMGTMKGGIVPEDKRAAIYIRTSTERQNEKVSPREQEDACHRIAEERGYIVTSDDLSTSRALLPSLPSRAVKVSESGLRSPEDMEDQSGKGKAVPTKESQDRVAVIDSGVDRHRRRQDLPEGHVSHGEN